MNPETNQYKKEFANLEDEADRVILPEDDIVLFEEEQPFDQVWLWTLMGLETLIVLIPLLIVGVSWWVMVLAGSFIAMTMALMSSLKLYTRIDNVGIHYRFRPFHRREQVIYWDEIDSAQVRKYSPVLEYGGWGMRTMSRNGKAYNVKGEYGIQVVKKNGKRILIGTQDPEEAQRHLKSKPVTV